MPDFMHGLARCAQRPAESTPYELPHKKLKSACHRPAKAAQSGSQIQVGAAIPEGSSTGFAYVQHLPRLCTEVPSVVLRTRFACKFMAVILALTFQYIYSETLFSSVLVRPGTAQFRQNLH